LQKSEKSEKNCDPIGIELGSIGYSKPNHCASQVNSFTTLLCIFLYITTRLYNSQPRTHRPPSPHQIIFFHLVTLPPPHPQPAVSSLRRTTDPPLPPMRSEEDSRKRSEHARRQVRDARGRFCSAGEDAPRASAIRRIPSSAKRKPETSAIPRIPSSAKRKPEASAIPSTADTAPEASARRDRSTSERVLRACRRREIRSGSGSGVATKKKSRSRSSRRTLRDDTGPSFVISCSSEESSGDESAPEKVNFCDELSTLLIC
jgi:hypothetical protein